MRHAARFKKVIYASVTHAEFLAAVAEGAPVRIVRVKRTLEAGHFANIETNPFSWAISVERDGELALITSQRKKRREWTELDRADDFLRTHAVRCWCVINELD